MIKDSKFSVFSDLFLSHTSFYNKVCVSNVSVFIMHQLGLGILVIIKLLILHTYTNISNIY